MQIGYALIGEEHGPGELVANARRAEAAGFEYLSISDHFLPWLDVQGESPFVWSVLGAVAEETDLPLMTGVTCPIKRYHPAIVAQAAATVALLSGGRFTLGLGSGEALNEHVVGGEWPDPVTRLEMLEEAVEVIRQLFDGEEHRHRGRYFTLDRARLYSLPDEPVPLVIAAGGPMAAELAGRVGGGLLSVSPDADLLEAYRAAGGTGPAFAQATVCWGPDEDTASRTLRAVWPQSVLDWDALADIPTPAGFAAASDHAPLDAVVGSKPVGNDVEAHVDSIRTYLDAGYERVALHNVGPDQAGFLEFAASDLLPAFRP